MARLAAPGDDDDVLNAGMHGFLDAVLDDGLVYKRQHLFGLGLGGGQEAGAETGGGEHGFSNLGCHTVYSVRGAGPAWQLLMGSILPVPPHTHENPRKSGAQVFLLLRRGLEVEALSAGL